MHVIRMSSFQRFSGQLEGDPRGGPEVAGSDYKWYLAWEHFGIPLKNGKTFLGRGTSESPVHPTATVTQFWISRRK